MKDGDAPPEACGNVPKRIRLLCLLTVFFVLVFAGSCGKSASQQEKEMHIVNSSSTTEKKNQIYLADPTVFADGGSYYLYGTMDLDTSQGFLVYSSRDLEHWKPAGRAGDGFALKKGDSFGSMGFWAPQVFTYRGSCYMAYVANERIAIAKSDDGPLGPFRQKEHTALFRTDPRKNIDPFVFFDDDGTPYLYYVMEQGGNQICVAELNGNLDEVKNEKVCIQATLPWENTAQAEWPVAEGPAVAKIDGLYYLLYCANDFRSPDYAVGYAVSNSPVGPWRKQEKPFLSRETVPALGTGHGDLFWDADRNLWYVFHTHFGPGQPTPRKTALVKLLVTPGQGDPAGIAADPKSFRYLQQDS